MQFVMELTGLTESILSIIGVVFCCAVVFLWVENQ